MTNKVKSELSRIYPLRMDEETFARVAVLQGQETRRIGRPQAMASILRQIIALGLVQLERKLGSAQ